MSKQTALRANLEIATKGRLYVPRRYPDHKPVLAMPYGKSKWWVKPEGQDGVAVWSDKDFNSTFMVKDEYEN